MKLNKTNIRREVDGKLGYQPWSAYSVLNDDTQDLMSLVISKLPKDIRDFTLNKISFYEVQDEEENKNHIFTLGLCINKRSKPTDFIVFFDSVFRYYNQDTKLYIIAHEIGHAYLNHMELGIDAENMEKEADEFAAEYGFPAPKELSNFKTYIKYFVKNSTLVDKISVVAIVLIFIWLIFLNYFFNSGWPY